MTLPILHLHPGDGVVKRDNVAVESHSIKVITTGIAAQPHRLPHRKARGVFDDGAVALDLIG